MDEKIKNIYARDEKKIYILTLKNTWNNKKVFILRQRLIQRKSYTKKTEAWYVQYDSP